MIIGKGNRLLLFNSGLAGYARVIIDRIIRVPTSRLPGNFVVTHNIAF